MCDITHDAKGVYLAFNIVSLLRDMSDRRVEAMQASFISIVKDEARKFGVIDAVRIFPPQTS